jgi:type I restriction enzyme S subunit
MRDSKIEWIGNIPATWKTSAIALQCSAIGSGSTPKSDNPGYYGGNIAWVQSGDLGKRYLDTTASKITESALSDISSLHVYHAPYLAIAMYGASIGSQSVVRIDSATNQAVCVVRANEAAIGYFYYAMSAAHNWLVYMGIGGTQPNLSQEFIRGFKIPQFDCELAVSTPSAMAI